MSLSTLVMQYRLCKNTLNKTFVFGNYTAKHLKVVGDTKINIFYFINICSNTLSFRVKVKKMQFVIDFNEIFTVSSYLNEVSFGFISMIPKFE